MTLSCGPPLQTKFETLGEREARLMQDPAIAAAVANTRAKLAALENHVISESYVEHDGHLTLCIINAGECLYFVGQSVRATPDQEYGRRSARENAIHQMYACFEGATRAENMLTARFETQAAVE